MPNLPISGLPIGAVATSDEVLPIVQDSTTKQISATDLGQGIFNFNLPLSSSGINLGGNLTQTGNTTHVGDTTQTGSFTIASSSGDFFIYGHKQFNYGAFQNNFTQSGSANVSYSFQLDTTDEAHEVSITSGSRITFANAGVYNIAFSAQVAQGAGKALVHIWFKRNGQNIPESATALNVNANDYAVAAWNFMKTFDAGDYAEIAWQTDQPTTTFPYLAAAGNIPIIPSIIVTVNQVR
jgi:hypothetical protein